MLRSVRYCKYKLGASAPKDDFCRSKTRKEHPIIANSKTTMPQYLSDIITTDNIKAWSSKDIILISAQCGKGKSYLIKNQLYDIAKERHNKILMFLHRKKTLEQFQEEIEKDCKTDVITLMSYQALEQAIIHNHPPDLSQYHYIISDEFHYFLSDSQFNKFTDLSFNCIMNQQQAVKIFMSATSKHIEEYIKQLYPYISPTKYEIPPNYDFLNIIMFSKFDTITEIINAYLTHSKKLVVFEHSAEKAWNLFQKYKDDAIFCCGSSCSHYKWTQNHEAEDIQQMLTTEKFDKNLLITTTALDAGFNIKDPQLHVMIVDIPDIDTMQQCIGRKRIIDSNDYLNVFIKNITNQKLNGFKSSFQRGLKMADYLSTHTEKELAHEFIRQYDKSGVIYDDEESHKKINPLMYQKRKDDIEQISKILNMDEFGYSKYLSTEVFGNKKERKKIDWMNENKTLTEWLDAHCNKPMLTVKDRQPLIEKLNIRQDGHIVKDINVINTSLTCHLHLPYQIQSYSEKITENGQQKRYKSIWKIYKLYDDKAS